MRWVRAAVVASVAAAALVAPSASGDGSSSAGASTRHPKTVTVDERANRKRVRLVVGDRLVVVLHSTYWQLPAPATGVLATTKKPVATPGTDCPRIPGSGCGMATATYRARAAGRTRLAARRDSCGEALRCVGSRGKWSVTVNVKA